MSIKENEIDFDNIWFQEDVATCHITNATFKLLQKQFGNSMTSENCDIGWPTRSFNLFPLKYFFGGVILKINSTLFKL